MKLITFMLHNSGYETVWAENGMRGDELVVLEKPDFIILDIQLPYIDGYEVLCRILLAEAEGLHLASVNIPDIIVSDVLMPVLDGFQFLRAAKKSDLLQMIPFIFYSAVYTGRQEVEFATSLGAGDVVRGIRRVYRNN